MIRYSHKKSVVRAMMGRGAVCLLSVLCLLCISVPSFAQDDMAEDASRKKEIKEKLGKFWKKGLGKVLLKFDNKLIEWEHSGIDTNYIAVPEKDRYIYIGAYSYNMHYDIEMPFLIENVDMPQMIKDYIPSNIQDKKYFKAKAHSWQAEMELGIDWRGLSIEIPIRIANKFSRSIGLAKNGSVWGARLRYKHVDHLNGLLDDAFMQASKEITNRMQNDPEHLGNTSPVETHVRTIPSDLLDLKVFYLEGYYVLNHRKFCLAAAVYGDMIQKKSAGSFIAMANYHQSQLKCNQMLNADQDIFKNNKVSLGFGYGYNLVFMGGKLVFHASFIPMISAWNHLVHKTRYYDGSTYGKWDTPEEANMWEAYDTHYYDATKYGKDSKIVLNCFGKFAVTYSYKQFLFNLSANYRQNLFHSSTGMFINNKDPDVQLNIGYRF